MIYNALLIMNGFFYTPHLICVCIVMLLLLVLIYIGVIRKKEQKEIEHLAYVDPLTGINNLNKFILDVRKKLSESKKNEQYVILSFDIDKFKYINTEHGYWGGDEVLINVANVLKDSLKNGEIFARTESDHFLIFSDYKKDESITKKFYHLIQHFNKIDHHDTKIYFSCGIYRILSTDNHNDIEAMINKANMARKTVKGNYKISFIFYESKMHDKLILEKQMENDMHNALEKGEFEIYMQPKYDIKTLEIAGGEAMLRWNSSKNGFLVPENFNPLFERNGFILTLDFFIVEVVCKKIREWMDNGFLPMVISMNQSRLHFDEPLYVEKMKAMVQKYNIPPNLIEIEWTESAFVRNEKEAVEIGNKLHKFGFRLALDNYGKGYSSFDLLKNIKLDVIKIDGDFVKEITESQRSRLILENVIQLAKKLKMQTVAEGVETMKQMEFLKKHDCDMLQGFLYAKPLTMEEFESRTYS